MRLLDRHTRKAGISTNRLATGAASPWQIKTWDSVAFDLGDYARARALYRDGLRIRHELGLQRGYAYSFEFIADVDEIEKRYERAVQLLAAAETLRVRIGAPVEQINQKENEDALTRLRAQLGEVVFELAWAKGATDDHRASDRARVELTGFAPDVNLPRSCSV